MDIQLWLPLWLPLAGVVVGWALGYLSDQWRERESRRKDFQRDTIIEAQDLMVRRMRLVKGMTFALDQGELWDAVYSEGDRFRFHRESVIESADIAWRLVALASRIEDEKLSTLLTKIVTLTSKASEQDDPQAPKEAADDAVKVAKQFNDRAHQVLPDPY